MEDVLNLGEVKESFKNLMKAASFSPENTHKTLHMISRYSRSFPFKEGKT